MTRYFEAHIRDMWFKNPIVPGGIAVNDPSSRPFVRLSTMSSRIVVAEMLDSSMYHIISIGNHDLRWILEQNLFLPNSYIHRRYLQDMKPLEFNLAV